MTRIYLASSWRNPYQPTTVGLLRAAGHDVYDFRHPPGGDHLGFSWDEVDVGWRRWTSSEYLNAIRHPIARAGFESDFRAMQWADVGVLLLPAGRSAHLEAGYFVGAGKPLFIVLDPAEFAGVAGATNPELMYLMATGLTVSIDHIVDQLARYEARPYIAGDPVLDSVDAEMQGRR